MHFSIIGDKNDSKLTLAFPETLLAICDLGNLMDFLGHYDGIGPKI
jgi:hypothetical protein